eukprot:NODE_8529_length_1489_cov_3.624082.p2 GENE.NODE_8529_length_1489_cov_3.624082~~NODE_8529_length_1489_cov_3.624082.p2  ORF type:complete len:175 (-),score=38.12 NODE_8529_length_1489_cov_3.624082:470-994(-)
MRITTYMSTALPTADVASPLLLQYYMMPACAISGAPRGRAHSAGAPNGFAGSLGGMPIGNAALSVSRVNSPVTTKRLQPLRRSQPLVSLPLQAPAVSFAGSVLSVGSRMNSPIATTRAQSPPLQPLRSQPTASLPPQIASEPPTPPPNPFQAWWLTSPRAAADNSMSVIWAPRP